MKKIIYIFSNGELQRKNNTLCFSGDQGNKYFPVEDISDIFVFGEVQFNKKLLEFLSQKEILLHYFNHHEYYMGTFYPREHLNSGYMTLRQAEHYLDEKKRADLARGFVEGSMRNILQVLRYYGNRGRAVEEYLDRIEDYLRGLSQVKGIEEFMALEGNAREQYYQAFDAILQKEDFRFEKRTRRPPENRLNTLISFGNSILYTLVLGEIYRTHLDPRIGYLHATNFRRFSLNLDVAEIFKPILVDRVIFTIIGKGMLRDKDFDQEARGLILTERGKKVFLEELNNRLTTTIRHRELDREVSYRRLIRMELYKLEKHLMGENEYKPFISRW